MKRYLWHIPHQALYVLCKYGVKRKSAEWLYVVMELMEKCAIRPLVDCHDTIQAIIASNKTRLEKDYRVLQGKEIYERGIFLENARGDIFKAIENQLEDKTSSIIERLFRTVNMRVDVNSWSTKGSLNVTKVRVAYYYNLFDE